MGHRFAADRLTLFCLAAGALTTAACGGREASPAPDPVPEAVEAPIVPEPAEESASDEPLPAYVTDDELTALGIRIEELGEEGAALLCRGEHCVCREPLGEPITMDDNLTGFRTALANEQGNRPVNCVSGATGTCGDHRYFLFAGGVYRHEMRWFDESSVRVFQRNVTDYPEFCEHRAMARIQGQIPRCATVAQTELICGDSQTVLTPLDDLLALLEGRGPRGAGP